jgi:putative hemolysin
LLLRLLGLRASREPPVTEEEIKVLMEQGAQAGVFEEHEQVLVSRVFRLDDLKVTGIMTPRSDIVFIDLEAPLEDNMTRMIQSNHSRFPVTRGGPDNVVGMVHAKNLLADAASGKTIQPSSQVVKPLFVPSTLTVMQVAEEFKKRRQTTALVVNEHGELQGMVTLNDVMEAMVGDIATVGNEEERDILRREDGSWLMDGSITIERFKDVLDIDETLPEEEEGSYHTLGGFVMMQLGRVPQPSESFEWRDLRVEVVDMDGNRIDKVLVTPMSPGRSARKPF